MRSSLVRWTPWLLVALAGVVFVVAPDADGPVLVLVWGIFVGLYRYGAAVLPDRRSRLIVDGLFAIACSLAAFEGGWYLLPAVLAFSIADVLAGDARSIGSRAEGEPSAAKV